MSFDGASMQRNALAATITIFHRANRARLQLFDMLQHVGHTFERGVRNHKGSRTAGLHQLL